MALSKKQDNEEDWVHCDACNGSGEGSADGSRCTKCKGKGEVCIGEPEDDDDPLDGWDSEMDAWDRDDKAYHDWKENQMFDDD